MYKINVKIRQKFQKQKKSKNKLNFVCLNLWKICSIACVAICLQKTSN